MCFFMYMLSPMILNTLLTVKSHWISKYRNIYIYCAFLWWKRSKFGYTMSNSKKAFDGACHFLKINGWRGAFFELTLFWQLQPSCWHKSSRPALRPPSAPSDLFFFKWWREVERWAIRYNFYWNLSYILYQITKL